MRKCVPFVVIRGKISSFWFKVAHFLDFVIEKGLPPGPSLASGLTRGFHIYKLAELTIFGQQCRQ